MLDRTSEFFSTVTALKAHGGLAAAPAPAPLAEHSALHRASVEHARATKRAGRQVSKLRELSLQQGQFNNPGPRINELCGALKRELASLDAGMRALGEAAARVGSGGGGGGGEGPTSAHSHWAAVVETLQGHLLGLTRGFQDALRARAATLQGCSGGGAPPPAACAGGASSQHFSSFPPPTPAAPPAAAAMHHSTWVPESLPEASPLFAPPAASQPPPPPPHLRRRQGAAAAAPPLAYTLPSSSSSSFAPAPPPPHPGLSYGYSAQTLASMAHSRTRASDAQAVEGVIVELGGMFTRMASLVREQGDVLERIDADVVEAEGNVKAGQEELSKLYDSMQKNRGFILHMFGVLVFIILLVKFIY